MTKALHRCKSFGNQPTDTEYVCWRCEESASIPDDWMHQQHPHDAAQMMNRARKFYMSHQHCQELTDVQDQI